MNEKKRIIAFDFGIKRIGVAISDPLQIGAFPLHTFANDSALKSNLEKIKSEYQLEIILLGMPKNFSGAEHQLEKEIMNFKIILEKIFEIEVQLVDEMFTSSIAQNKIVESYTKKSSRRDKGLIDRHAAAILIEDYLRKRNYFSKS